MKKFFFALIALSLMLTACGQIGLQGEVIAPTAPPTATPAAVNTPAPTITPLPADPTAQCPTPGEGQALYVSRDNGYCFLYPATFTAQPDFLRPTEAVDISGLGITKGLDTVAIHLTVASNGPADGLDSQGYVEKWLTAYRMDPSLAIQPLNLNGQTATLIEDVPGGMFSQRQAFVVANDFKYQITLTPQPGLVLELTEASEQVWDLMAQSLTLFPPAAPRPLARPAEVCPQPDANTKLLVDEAQGYCLLYPADFELGPDFPGQIIGGPVLRDTQDWGKVRTSLTLAGYDQPPSQLEQPTLPEQIDPNSVQTLTIGGGQAVIYDFTGGPWRQRTADILVNDSRYTMVGPWDAEAFPQGVADAQRLWDTVLNSIVFFGKWR